LYEREESENIGSELQARNARDLDLRKRKSGNGGALWRRFLFGEEIFLI
jgi:hypothetical protein